MIISLKKQRNISLSEISLTGRISSIKNNSAIEFESSLERDFIYLLEYNPDVNQYIEQPIIIKYYSKRKEKSYTPDFYVEYSENKKELIEIKYQEDLKVNEDKYRDKFSATQEFCLRNNMIFKILTEKDIRTPTLFNAKFLLPYKRLPRNTEKQGIKIIADIIKSERKISVKDIIETATQVKEKRPEYLYLLWYIVANNFVYYNKDVQLNMNTVIEVRDNGKSIYF